MDILGGQPTIQEFIWLCGKPRFLRESLSGVLQNTFGTGRVREQPHLEPPQLWIPESLPWLIWFLNNKHPISSALDEFVASHSHPGLVLIENDGCAFVRRADGTELQRTDISLQELIKILKVPLAQERIFHS